MAMESRGFGRKGRSFYKEYKLSRKDWIALSLMGASLLLWALILA